ncbi:MAG: chemotaxis response regulator protein-glutamate methylesterase [Clostridiales bacterium]|nr:chemotaxis response regulator protein-glutamate methylesterase [Clostridiales bacterium]
MPIKVLVVDDSIVYRTKLQLSLSRDPDIKVVGVASNADEASRKIRELSPDVLTLDIEMPNMNGLEFLDRLMPINPLPVVVVSSLPVNALDALGRGAVDFVKKPEAGVPNASEVFIEKLIETIKVASKAKIDCCPHKQKKSEPVTESIAIKRTPQVLLPSSTNKLIAIGASTGGTEAIINVVKDLPKNSPPVLIVQHMPATFTQLYAERLNGLCKMKAKEAADYDRVVAGQIIVAAGGFHMTLHRDEKGYYIRSKPGEKVSGHCPSVDVLFSSVANVMGKNAIGVILTGMGADGAAGITKMHSKGAYTIGQDKDTSVVYGMPMEAYKLGGISRQLPLHSICDEIIKHVFV